MFTFPGQREDEQVLMLIRKHPIVFFKLILVFVLTIVLPLALFVWFWFNQYPLDEFPRRALIMGIFVSLYLLYGLLFACAGWLNEEFDLFILTNQRLMDITQVSLFKRSVSSTPLDRIQDATSKMHGFLQTIFRYGDIIIQTASGSATDIHIDRVPEPGETARRIMDVVHHKYGRGVLSAESSPESGQGL